MTKTFRTPQEWSGWVKWLAAGLHGRSRWRLPIIFIGMLFARGRRTVASWLRAAGVSTGFANYYYFISSIGRRVEKVAGLLLSLLLGRVLPGPRVLVGIDDTPTKRYGPKVQGAGIHHNPTPGPSGAKFLFGHVWVTAACLVRHPRWGTIGLPLLSALYIRKKDIGKLPPKLHWCFQTKLQQAAHMIHWLASIVLAAGKELWVVVDGFYPKRPVFKEVRSSGVTLVGRLRKDAKLYDLPPAPKPGEKRGPGRPPKYGPHRISLAKRAGQPGGWETVDCVQYGKEVTKSTKTFLASYHPAYGTIRVVIVKEEAGPQFFSATNPDATPREILEAGADRGTMEQIFHDVKEIGGGAQQQVRRLWTNVGAWHLNLWLHTLVELWAWNKPKRQLSNRRASPWDDPERRPSHSERRKALRRRIFREEYSRLANRWHLPQKIPAWIQRLLDLAL
jgi:hypothetical protein